MTTAQGLSLPIEQQLQLVQLDEKRFELMQRQAKLLASSDFVPDTFKNNISNCSLIIEMAHRLNTDAFLVSRQIVVIHNKPSFSSKFVIALLNRAGVLRGRLKFKATGNPGTDTEGCIAHAIEASTGELLEGPEVTIAMAKKEGWFGKNGSKWPSMPQIMLQYRAASFFVSFFFPEILAGFQTVEEIQDTGPMRDVDGDVTRTPRRQPEPRESETVVIDGKHVDTETGEIVSDSAPEKTPETAPGQSGDMFETQGSPGFVALVKKLMETDTEEQTRILMKSSLLTKCSAKERAEFLQMCETRLKAIQAGMLQTEAE